MTSSNLTKANLILSKIQSDVVDGLIRESDVLTDSGFNSMLSMLFKPDEPRPQSLAMMLYNLRVAFLRGTVSLSLIEDNIRGLMAVIRQGKISRKSP